MSKPTSPAVTTAYCTRTQMVGGGTSYHVYFRIADKPSRPLHGFTYATTILMDFNSTRQEFYSVLDAIGPKSYWGMECGWDKYNRMKQLEKAADRLSYRIAVKAFPELDVLQRLPALWASWTLPSAQREVPVQITLPE